MHIPLWGERILNYEEILRTWLQRRKLQPQSATWKDFSAQYHSLLLGAKFPFGSSDSLVWEATAPNRKDKDTTVMSYFQPRLESGPVLGLSLRVLHYPLCCYLRKVWIQSVLWPSLMMIYGDPFPRHCQEVRHAATLSRVSTSEL